MTDNEIIKALDICGHLEGCADCPLVSLECVGKCMNAMLLNALELINRQKAEIERLEAELKIKSQRRANLYEIIDAHRSGISEGIKKFAKRVKKHFEVYTDDEESNAIYMRNLINDLVEEMTESGEADAAVEIISDVLNEDANDDE